MFIFLNFTTLLFNCYLPILENILPVSAVLTTVDLTNEFATALTPDPLGPVPILVNNHLLLPLNKHIYLMQIII